MALYARQKTDFLYLKSFFKRTVTTPGLYTLFLKLRPFSGRYYVLLVFLAGMAWYALFTRQVIGQIKQDAVNVTQSYAELVRTAISESINDEEVGAIFTEIIQKLNFPIVITDTAWNPVTWKNIGTGPFFNRRVILPSDTSLAARSEVRKKVAEYRRLYEPRPIGPTGSGIVTGYVVYGNSDIVRSISWMPFVELGLVISILLFAYFAFHNIRVTERSNLWVGLAKETAHQLGTPISSLMGWVEYMQTTLKGEGDVAPEVFREQLDRIYEDMKNDLTRLRKVTARFSQIGSIPALTPCDINVVLQDVMKYFRLRLPLLGKKITIEHKLGNLPKVPANRELIEWVFENLLKNSLDALNKPEGLIEIRTEYIECDKIVRVYHRDTGKGISWEDQKKIFSPGFTTKTRGWGLGLTLAKRIVEDYHNGDIYVNSSQKDKGTVFCVDLPVGT